MLIVGRKLSNLCKKVALCRLGNLTWRLRKMKRRFGTIKRRFNRTETAFYFCKFKLSVFQVVVKPEAIGCLMSAEL